MMQWLNRNIAAMGLVSLLSDFSHEMATAILPTFLISLGGSPALLGVIEGFADAAVSFAKLFAGWYSDILGKRKPFAVIGYALTGVGVGILPFATRWYHVLAGRVVAWAGKGLRKPPRDALLVESTQPQFYGRVFGFHRSMDSLGAILGPACAYIFIAYFSYTTIFLIALIPSLLAVAVMATVKEMRSTKKERFALRFELKQMPTSYWILLISSTFFALGKFADSMLILRLTQQLAGENSQAAAVSMAIFLYMIRNCIYSFGSYPIGIIADRMGKRQVLIAGYCVSAGVSLLLALNEGHMALLVITCLLAGLSLAMTDATEKSYAAEFMPRHVLGTGYGMLALMAGIAAFFSSATIGFLWTHISPFAGFSYSALLNLCAAAILIVGIKKRENHGKISTV